MNASSFSKAAVPCPQVDEMGFWHFWHLLSLRVRKNPRRCHGSGVGWREVTKVTKGILIICWGSAKSPSLPGCPLREIRYSWVGGVPKVPKPLPVQPPGLGLRSCWQPSLAPQLSFARQRLLRLPPPGRPLYRSPTAGSTSTAGAAACVSLWHPSKKRWRPGPGRRAAGGKVSGGALLLPANLPGGLALAEMKAHARMVGFALSLLMPLCAWCPNDILPDDSLCEHCRWLAGGPA